MLGAHSRCADEWSPCTTAFPDDSFCRVQRSCERSNSKQTRGHDWERRQSFDMTHRDDAIRVSNEPTPTIITIQIVATVHIIANDALFLFSLYDIVLFISTDPCTDEAARVDQNDPHNCTVRGRLRRSDRKDGKVLSRDLARDGCQRNAVRVDGVMSAVVAVDGNKANLNTAGSRGVNHRGGEGSIRLCKSTWLSPLRQTFASHCSPMSPQTAGFPES